ncbi:MAG: hypothetical protein IJX96_04540 [Clostridia bacterium]|nr:hypothetical protein [Clostridia bacterium]
MPFLQYKCQKCGKKFDELVKSYLDEVKCPDCGGERRAIIRAICIPRREKRAKNARETVKPAAVVVEQILSRATYYII